MVQLLVCDIETAATGLEHKLTVVTRHMAGFFRSGGNTLNPFTT